MTSFTHKFRGLLQQQFDTVCQLSQTLAQEHAAISGNKLEDMEAILADKQRHVWQLDTLSQEFLDLMRSQTSDNKIDITAVLRHYDPQGSMGLVSLWQQVEKILSQCRHSNSVNGKIINLNQRQVQQALSILRNGEFGAGHCYSPTGARQDISASRTLGKV